MEQPHNFLLTGEDSNTYSVSVSPDTIFDKNKIYQIRAYITIHVTTSDNKTSSGHYTLTVACRDNKFIGSTYGYRLDTISSDPDFPIDESNISCNITNEKFYIKCVGDKEMFNIKLMCDVNMAVF